MVFVTSVKPFRDQQVFSWRATDPDSSAFADRDAVRVVVVCEKIKEHQTLLCQDACTKDKWKREVVHLYNRLWLI